jgi:hypothetical protein
MAYKPIELMTKAELLMELEHIPQSYWPPRPTRQNKATIFAACLRARSDRLFEARLNSAIYRRQASYEAANARWPLPISGTSE